MARKVKVAKEAFYLDAVDMDILQARKDRKAGHGKFFSSVEEMIEYLHRTSPRDAITKHP